MIGNIFDLTLQNPMVNILVLLTVLLFGSFGLAIIAFTILVRLITFPLTLRQLHQTRAMQPLQPVVQDIQKKYNDPKRRQEEVMKAYREAGVNPLGCLGPMLLQFPVLIALFYSVRKVLPESPEALEALSGRLYDFAIIQHAVPLEEHFLGMDLRAPSILMVVLVGLTTWGQSKTTVSYATDERARAQQQMMTWMLPFMFAFFALSFPSGVSLYWTVNSIVGIGFNIVTYGFPALGIKPLVNVRAPAPRTPSAAAAGGQLAPASQGAGKSPSEPARESRNPNGPGRNKRQNRRRRT
ncbi:MAG: membrane protein insertase YidC [Gemmataceae bacterium]|nr:membrane protein insertase YidC [Gemmataceae bacterium]